jgi:hypothetical protein
MFRETGYISVPSTQSGETQSIDVVLTKTYDTVPYVILTSTTSGAYFLIATTSISKTGFILNARNPISYVLTGGVLYYTVL